MKIKSMIIEGIEAQESLKAIEGDDAHEAQEGLVVWGAVGTVADAVVRDVKATGKSTTLDDLYEEIKRRYTPVKEYHK